MKAVDIITLIVFVIALIVLCFFTQCGLDVYFLIAGFVVAVLAALRMYIKRDKSKGTQN